jgi:hypothetical protein
MYGGLASFGDSYLNLCHGKGSANKDRHKPAVFANLDPLVVKVGMPNIWLSGSTNGLGGDQAGAEFSSTTLFPSRPLDTNPTLYLQRGRSFGTKELCPEWA